VRGNEPPTNSEAVRATLRGIRGSTGTAKVRKTPILAETARAMAQAAPVGLKGFRDRALLLLGFAGAFRRSELVALDVADLEETEEGMRVSIRRSKTDQEGKGEVIAIVRGSVNCPVKAVKNWLQAISITEGPMFRPVTKGGKVGNSRLTDKSVASIIKTYARRLGLNEADFSGHSLRSGFLTSAARRGASVFKMRDVSRHKSMDVLQSYIPDAELFRDHAGAGLLQGVAVRGPLHLACLPYCCIATNGRNVPSAEVELGSTRLIAGHFSCKNKFQYQRNRGEQFSSVNDGEGFYRLLERNRRSK
jgi:integrase